MPADSSAIVQKVPPPLKLRRTSWNYPPSLFELPPSPRLQRTGRRPGAHVLKNARVGYGLPVRQTGDYVEQITYLLFGSGLRPPGYA